LTRPELTASLALWRRRHAYRQRRLDIAHQRNDTPAIEKWHRLLAQAGVLIHRRETQLAHAKRQPGVALNTLWLPGAERVPGRDAGVFVAAGPKIVWHTTEGSSVDGAIGAYRATGSWPHMTFDPHTGRLVQHIALNRAARALEHPAGTVETNRAHAIQVELVGFAAHTPEWPGADYARIAGLARRIEAAVGVPRRKLAGFNTTPHRLAAGTWLRGAGHCGHQHVPGNHHWDPGAFRIDLVI
jgi:hypothetical protein